MDKDDTQDIAFGICALLIILFAWWIGFLHGKGILKPQTSIEMIK
jgi:hypothetical protein